MKVINRHENTIGEVGTIFFESNGERYELITVKQAAKEFEVTVRTIQRWIDEGILIGIKVSRSWLVAVYSVERVAETLDEFPF